MNWISVKDRYPLVGQMVFVIGPDGRGGWYAAAASYSGPARSAEYPNNFVWDARDDCFTDADVTHWAEIVPP